MKSTKKTKKAAEKKQDGQKHEQPTTGREHTIAKARTTPATGKPATVPEKAPVAVPVGDEPAPTTPAKPPKKAKGPAVDGPTTAPDDASEIVVFAFRLTRGERDELHAAAGSAKASKFVKAIVLAGARGDLKAVQEIVDEAQASRK